MEIEMTIKGLMIDPITNMPIVILKDGKGNRVLPIWVGIFEANAIALQIENITTPRPMTHDLLRNMLSDLEATVERIVVGPAVQVHRPGDPELDVTGIHEADFDLGVLFELGDLAALPVGRAP